MRPVLKLRLTRVINSEGDCRVDKEADLEVEADSGPKQ